MRSPEGKAPDLLRLRRGWRWLRFNWWPWVNVPAGVMLFLLWSDPATDSDPSPLLWTLLSVALPVAVSVGLYRRA